MIQNIISQLLKKKNRPRSCEQLLAASSDDLMVLWQQMYVLAYGQDAEGISDRCIDSSIYQTHFQVKGFNPEESEHSYFGRFTIDGDTKIAKWEIGLSSQMQWGEVEVFNQLMRIYFHYIDEGESYSGVVLYRWMSDDVMLGLWIEDASDDVGVETLTVV